MLHFIKSVLRSCRDQLRIHWYRRNYYISGIWRRKVPVRPLSYLPSGFSVRRVGSTGVSVIENFCTREEAERVIAKASGRLSRSFVLVEGALSRVPERSSETALVFDRHQRDPELLPLLYKGAMLVGVPYTHIESIHITRYAEGEYYKAHVDYGDDYAVNRLYTVLLYLNDLDEDQGGETVFSALNLAVRPKLGRAVSWTNMNPDGTCHAETSHAAFPVKNGGTKWILQLWFHPYEMFKRLAVGGTPPQSRPGIPLTGEEQLPEGAWVSGPTERKAQSGVA